MHIGNMKLVCGLRVYCIYGSIRCDGILTYIDEFHYRILWYTGEEIEYYTYKIYNFYFDPKPYLLRKVVI